MKKITDLTMEDLAIHHLRNDLDSIKSAGYNKKFAREYLYNRYVNRDRYITAEAFTKTLDETF